MDKFIESFSERPASQKILITVGIAAGLLFIIAVLYFTTTPSIRDSSEKSASANISPTSSPIYPPAQPNTTWSVYQGESFRISYPPNLSGTPGVINGGSIGTAFSITGSQDGTDFSIEIQVTNSETSPLENIYRVFRGFKYKEEEDVVGNVSAKKFSGRVGNLREMALVFENRNKAYKIQLMYNSEGANTKIEEIFKGVLSTFSLL